jgi:HSP20 family protein
VKKDDVKITVDNGILSIRGERKQEQEEKGKTFHRVELLSLEIPKTEKAQPKAIEVKVA